MGTLLKLKKNPLSTHNVCFNGEYEKIITKWLLNTLPKQLPCWFIPIFYARGLLTYLQHYNIFLIIIPPDTTLFCTKNLFVFFLFFHKNIYCGYSLEAPQWGASNEYPQYMFTRRNKENIFLIPPLNWGCVDKHHQQTYYYQPCSIFHTVQFYVFCQWNNGCITKLLYWNLPCLK